MDLRSRAKERAPRTPNGVRIYAIGDVHGRADLLGEVVRRIDAHNEANPAPQSVEVFLGDYVDRGPQSRQVLDILTLRQRQRQMICLKGNHETYITEFLRNPSSLARWKAFGGLETLVSYGLRPTFDPDEAEQRELATELDRTLPQAHRRFFSGLPISFSCGDYFFAHAGVRPGVPLQLQQQDDLLLIRQDFLRHDKAFGKIIIHGHTPVTEPETRFNRINIDTGAYATGKLTCLVLEGESVSFL